MPLLPSQRIELASYRYVCQVGAERSLTVGSLAVAVKAESGLAVERLKHLNTEGYITLSKYLTKAWIETQSKPQLKNHMRRLIDTRVLYSEAGSFWTTPGNFFSVGDFVVEITPRGRLYFESLERQERASPLEGPVMPAERKFDPRDPYPKPAMGKRLAIVIAVEKYADTRIGAVRYAEDDANGFAAALQLGGAVDKVSLLSVRATKTTINSQLRQHVKALTTADQLYIFYAGHGFSKNGHNFITCHDTDIDDLEDTSINLKELLDACAKSACKRIALFLDSCESGITELPEIRGIYATLSSKELDEFFRAAEYRTCFASCKASEESHSSEVLKHGVWTHHVIEALEGNARAALEGGKYVTADSLQNYLALEIPRTLRKVFSKPVVQTPWVYGSQSRDFVISDLADVLKERSAAKPGYDQVKRVFLRFEESVKIASLSGFIKGAHRVPVGNNSATNSFVERISKKEVAEELETIFARIRTHLKYKRKDLLTDDAHIVTPDFEFWVECTQDSEDPSLAVISRRLTNISPAIVDGGEFNEVFEDCFQELTFEFNKDVDVAELIDQLEDLNIDRVKLDYPADSSYCELSIEGSRLSIRIEAGSLTLRAPEPSAPKQLVLSFFDVQKALTGSPVVKAIAGSSKK